MSHFRFLAVLACAPLLSAQYQDLSTGRNGTKLAFSSRLSLVGEQRNDQPKLFEIDVTGQLKTLRSTLPVILYPGDRAPSNFPSLTRPEYNSAGTMMAFTGDRWCIGGSGCIGVERTQGNVLWLDSSRESPSSGMARISANGRWGVYYNHTSLASPYRFYRVDFETGWSEFSATGLYGTAGTGRRIIANDGTVLNSIGMQTLVMRKPRMPDVVIPLGFSTSFVTISNDARFAIAQSSDVNPGMWLIDLYTYQTVPFLWAYEGVTQPALSEDGMTLLFLSGANWAATNDSLAVQVWTMDLMTGGLRQWTHEPSGIAEATISGDGLVVWAATKDGRLIRVDGLSGETQVLLNSAPQAGSPESAVWAPGSRYRLEGGGLGGMNLRWQGADLPVVVSAYGHIEFMVPWEAALGSGKLEIEQPGSPFQPQQIEGEMKAVAPRFIKTNGFIHGLREDGSPLTAANPAKPGEVVMLLMRGLGPLDAQGRTLQTVAVSAAEFPSFEVVASTSDPGTQGTYRLSVRVPAAAQGQLNLFVRAPDEEYPNESGWIPVEPR
jgi:uncharacterized protein (TIGR03437 family)